MTEFKIHVERIVRPIRGSESRKNKMREELMGHLLTAHAEAMKSSVDDPVGFAIERLGDADVLREELQASVPRWERLGSSKLSVWFFDSLEAPSDMNRTDALNVSFQATLGMVTFMMLLSAPVIFFVTMSKWMQAGSVEWFSLQELMADSFLTLIIPSLVLSYFVCMYTFIKSGLHKVIHHSSGTSSVLKGCIGMAFYIAGIGLFFAELLILDGQWGLIRNSMPMPELLMLLIEQPRIYACLLVGIGVIIYGLSAERKQYLEWGCLEINE